MPQMQFSRLFAQQENGQKRCDTGIGDHADDERAAAQKPGQNEHRQEHPRRAGKKNAERLFSQPRELRILVVIMVRLIGSNWKAQCEMSSPLFALE